LRKEFSGLIERHAFPAVERFQAFLHGVSKLQLPYGIIQGGSGLERLGDLEKHFLGTHL